MPMPQAAEQEFIDYMAATPEAYGLGPQTQMGPGSAADAKLNVRFYNRDREVVQCSRCAAATKMQAPEGLDGVLLAVQQAMPMTQYVKPPEPGEPCCSTNAGRPIFKSVVYVEIRNPGDQDCVIDREARVDPRKNDSDARKFPRHWEAFRRMQDQTRMAGTPLSVLTNTVPQVLSSTQVAELAHPKIGIYSVEQLADLPDTTCQQYRGFVDLRRKAREFLEITKADAPVAKIQAMRAEEQKRMQAQEVALAQQGEQIRKLTEQLAAFMAKANAPAVTAHQAQEPVAAQEAKTELTLDGEPKPAQNGRKKA